jgi:hypothetical protein
MSVVAGPWIAQPAAGARHQEVGFPHAAAAGHDVLRRAQEQFRTAG